MSGWWIPVITTSGTLAILAALHDDGKLYHRPPLCWLAQGIDWLSRNTIERPFRRWRR